MKTVAVFAALGILAYGAAWSEGAAGGESPLPNAYREGRALFKEGRFAEAAGRFEEAMRLCEARGGDPSCTANALTELAWARWKGGEGKAALEAAERAILAHEALGGGLRLAETLVIKGRLLQETAEYAAALRAYGRALDVYVRGRDAAGEAAACGNISLVHADIGNAKDALRWLERAMRIFAARGDERSLATALGNMGLLHKEEGNFARSRARYAEARELYRKAGDAEGEFIVRNNLALLRLAEGDARAAAEALKEVVKDAAEAGVDKTFRAQMHESAAQALLLAGDHEGARREAEAALALARETGRRETAWEAEHRLGAALVRLGEPVRGAESLRRAVEGVESIRASLDDAGQKEGFLSRRLDVYESLVELLLAGVRDWGLGVGKKEATSDSSLTNAQTLNPNPSATEAFGVAERMKARSFLDELGAAKFSRAGVPEELLKEKRVLEARMKWLRERQ